MTLFPWTGKSTLAECTLFPYPMTGLRHPHPPGRAFLIILCLWFLPFTFARAEYYRVLNTVAMRLYANLPQTGYTAYKGENAWVSAETWIPDGTRYCYAEVKAGAGWMPASNLEVLPRPIAGTLAAKDITREGATLQGSYTRTSNFVGWVSFEYGLTTEYGMKSEAIYVNTESFSIPVTGLQGAKTYHFRAVVSNPQGYSQGADRTFTTLPPLPPPAPAEFSVTGEMDAITLKWPAPSPPVDQLRIERRAGLDGDWRLVRTARDPFIRSWRDTTGLLTGTTYYYRMSAYNAISLYPSSYTVEVPARVLETALVWLPDGTASIRFTAAKGQSYVIGRSAGLETWERVFTSDPAGGAQSWTDTEAAGDGRRFYRVVPP